MQKSNDIQDIQPEFPNTFSCARARRKGLFSKSTANRRAAGASAQELDPDRDLLKLPKDVAQQTRNLMGKIFHGGHASMTIHYVTGTDGKVRKIIDL